MRRNNKQLIAVLLAAAMVFTGCAPAASTGDTSGTSRQKKRKPRKDSPGMKLLCWKRLPRKIPSRKTPIL